MRLIDADALKERAETVTLWNGDIRRFVSYETIDNAPTVLHDNYSMGYQDGVKKVLSERPQGEWIPVSDKYGEHYKFPFCSKEITGSDLNFCVKCGADMRGEEGET